jgi:uncharacterized protein involved in exopolysaccharide biosynthesis
MRRSGTICPRELAMTLFAFVDPAQIPLEAAPGFWPNRLALYAIGFFLFWCMSALAAFLTLYMVRTDSTRRGRD